MEIAPERAAELLEEGAIQLIDIREPYEREAGHIAESRHIEIDQLTGEAGTIDRDKPVVFYCRVGSRSFMAASAFRRAGYDAYTMTGGLEAWQERGLPLVPADGFVAPH